MAGSFNDHRQGAESSEHNQSKRHQAGPPDLDEILSKFAKDMLKKRRNSASNRTGSPAPQGDDGSASAGITMILGIAFAMWALLGIYIVRPAQEAVVLQFGRYHKTVGPGPHWIALFAQKRFVLNVERIDTYDYQDEMLTKDENIVDVAVSVQYRIEKPEQYLFQVNDPINAMRQATASALRQVVGHTTLDSILTTGRSEARAKIEEQLKSILDRYQTGLVITDVNLQPAKPPEQVTEAFDDAIKAREDEQRFINQAKAYTRKVIPVAEGQAARFLREAEAKQEQYKLKAKADTARFLALLPERERAPELTDQRLYFAALDDVLKHATKILTDGKGGQQMLYLPFDKIFERQGKVSPSFKAKVLSEASPSLDVAEQTTTKDASSLRGARQEWMRRGYSNFGG